MRPSLLVILGPTGVGKSELAVELATAFDGEVVNADSRQVYRQLDIGTGKPTREQRSRVAHHLLDVVDPDGSFDVSRFCRLAHAAINAILKRKRLPIVSGGTGLYIKALTQGIFQGPGRRYDIRDRLEREDRLRPGSLFDKLRRVDPDMARSIQPADRFRIIRAIEVYEVTGRPMSEWQRAHGFRDTRYRTLKIGLSRPKEELFRRIEQRTKQMIENGLIEEVRVLKSRGLQPDLSALQSIGYRQAALFLDSKLPFDQVEQDIVRETKRFVKQQMTWFKKDLEILWAHPAKEREKILDLVREFTATEGLTEGARAFSSQDGALQDHYEV